MKRKMFMLLLAIAICFCAINVKADVAQCHAQLNGYTTKVGVGEEFVYDVGTMGVPSNVYIYNIDYVIEYPNEDLELVSVGGKPAGAYNGWTVEAEHIINEHITVNTVRIHAHTDDKNKMYREISLNEFVKMAYVKFRVKSTTKAKSTNIGLIDGESSYVLLFDDDDTREMECNLVNTVVNIYTKDNNATLATLSVGKESLNPKFNANTLNYEVTVSNEIDTIQIDATCAGTNCKVSGTGLKKLSVGDNKFTITAKSEQGSTKDYTIKVVRKEKDEVYLKELTVKNGTLYPTFNPNITNYVIDIASDVDKLDLEYVSNDDKVNTIDVVGNEKLKVGKNYIEITVKNESKKMELKYEIVANKLAKQEVKKEELSKGKDTTSSIYKTLTFVFGFMALSEFVAIIIIGIAKKKSENN